MPAVAFADVGECGNRAGEIAAPRAANRDEADAEFAAVGRISSSTSRVKSEYSVCSAVMGQVLWARRMVFAAASDRPRYLTLAAFPRGATIAPTVSSMGTLGSTAVLIEQVDLVDAEALQARVAALNNVFGPSVGAFRAEIAEFRGVGHLVACAADGFADKFLVLAGPIGV